MKVFGKILKALAALAAIAGAVYVTINYGEKIVAWVKEKLNLTCCCGDDCCCEEECCCGNCECEEAPADETAEAVEETPAVQAEETDFEG